MNYFIIEVPCKMKLIYLKNNLIFKIFINFYVHFLYRIRRCHLHSYNLGL